MRRWIISLLEKIAYQETAFRPPAAMASDLKNLVMLEGLRMWTEKWLFRSVMVSLFLLVSHLLPDHAVEWTAVGTLVLVVLTIYVSTKRFRYHGGTVHSHGVVHPSHS